MKLSKKAKDALHDLYFFLVEYWGLDLEEQPHRRMCGIIQEGETNPDKPYSMLVVPRGTYKTSILRGAAVWKQLRQIFLFDNLYHRIVIASAVLSHGEASLRTIEGQLRTNRKLIADYGELFIEPNGRGAPTSRHPDGLMLAPRIHAGELASVAEPSFWVGSVRRISTGFHADGGAIDDLNNRENVATDAQREKVNDYWDLLFPIIARTDRGDRPSTIHLNATPWHDYDVRGRIVKKEAERSAVDPDYKSKWTILHEAALDVTADPVTYFFPSILGEKELEDLRENMSANLFSANYLCDPVGNKGFVQEDEIVRKPRASFPPDLKFLRVCVDPSQHTKAKVLGCYCAMVVAGFDRFNNEYIVDADGSRDWGPSDTIARLFDLDEQYPGVPILVEDKHMSYFDHSIHLEEVIRSKDGPRRSLRIQYVPAESETKYQKWEKLQPRFQRHQIFFAEEIAPKIWAEMREELVRGSASRFKDFLDALAMTIYGVRPRAEKEQAPVSPPKRADGTQIVTFAQMVPGIEQYFDEKKTR